VVVPIGALTGKNAVQAARTKPIQLTLW
jgi:hypothetical protein